MKLVNYEVGWEVFVESFVGERIIVNCFKTCQDKMFSFQLSILRNSQLLNKRCHFQFNPSTTWNSRNSIRKENLPLKSQTTKLLSLCCFISFEFSNFRTQFNTWLSRHEANFCSQIRNGRRNGLWISARRKPTKTKDDCVTSSAPPFIFRRLNDFSPNRVFSQKCTKRSGWRQRRA